MLYRPYGKTGFDVLVFGLGLMRLPENDKGGIDHAEASKMIRYAIDNGVNYLDTAYTYNGGESEEVCGEALRDGYREKVKIATKVPVSVATSEEKAREVLETQLKRLQTDYIDYYLFHSVDANAWKTMKEKNMMSWFEKFKQEGKIKHICFSYHDDYETFKEVIDAYDWDMAQIQMNFFDVDNQATLEGMKYAADKGVAIVIMEPLRGGSLVRVPNEIAQMYEDFPINRNPVEWAFKFMYDFPEVSSILSGVSSMDELKEDIAIFEEAKPSTMTEDEKKLMAKVRETYQRRTLVPCTACRYCIPCPSGVDIPGVFATYNASEMFENAEMARGNYVWMEESNAAKCVECGACEPKCPQHIEIIQELKKAHAFLTAK